MASWQLFNCKNLSTFIGTIVQILPFKGASLSRFYICEYKGNRFLTKLCFYRKTGPELYGIVDSRVISHTDAEINILRILKTRIIDANLTPCILELVYHKICEITPLVPSQKRCDRLMRDYNDQLPEDDVAQLICKYKDLVVNDLAHNKCAFLVLEKCDVSLNEYLQKLNTPIGIIIFESILFQVIYTVYIIQRIYPRFRHYDLHTDNIMLKFDFSYKFQSDRPQFLRYIIDGTSYYIPYFGIIPKIIDFGYSSLPEEGIMSNAINDKSIMYHRSNNDLLFLFHWIYATLSVTGGDKLGYVDDL